MVRMIEASVHAGTARKARAYNVHSYSTRRSRPSSLTNACLRLYIPRDAADPHVLYRRSSQDAVHITFPAAFYSKATLRFPHARTSPWFSESAPERHLRGFRHHMVTYYTLSKCTLLTDIEAC